MSFRSQNVLDNQGDNTIFTVWNFQGPVVKPELFQTVCSLVINLNRSAAIRFSGLGASVVMGISMTGWNTLGYGSPYPQELDDFEQITGQKHKAVATRGDLHFHIKGFNSSVCYDLAAELENALTPIARCVEEVHGFRYWDGRSIFGFVDGTENPSEQDKPFFGLIGEADPAFKGGSYLFVQKYIHDLKAFKQLSLEEQEKVFGRYKQSDIEMPERVKPDNSHSALANVGDDLKVIRENMPFGNMSTNEMGTYFIAYASTFSTVKKMLTRMYIGEPAGNYDRLLDFSTPLTGTLFFVPTMDMLSQMAGGAFAPGEQINVKQDNSGDSNMGNKQEGSLGIGAINYKK